MNAPHLMFVVTEDWYFASHRLGLAIAAREAGYRVSVVTRVQDHGAQIAAAQVHVIDWRHERGGLNPMQLLTSVRSLRHIYRRERPDIVHHVALEPALLGTLAARLAGVPRVVNAVAGMGWLYASRDGLAAALRPIVRAALSRLLRHPAVFAVVQNTDDEALIAQLGVPAERLTCIAGAGVDLSLFPPRAEPDEVPPVVVLPARLLVDKGVYEFVEAVRLLKARHVPVRAILAGAPDAGNRASVSNEAIARWVNDGLIEHVGWVRNMPSLLAACHIVCLPSYREGLPKALLEGAAASRPIVTTDVPGCRAVVRDGDNGLLVPARDAARLADALQKLIGDGKLREQMGKRGRERAEREWSSTVVNTQMLSFHARVAP